MKSTFPANGWFRLLWPLTHWTHSRSKDLIIAINTFKHPAWPTETIVFVMYKYEKKKSPCNCIITSLLVVWNIAGINGRPRITDVSDPNDWPDSPIHLRTYARRCIIVSDFHRRRTNRLFIQSHVSINGHNSLCTSRLYFKRDRCNTILGKHSE